MSIPDRQPPTNDGPEVALPVEGGEIYVRQDGPPDAPALLLIHGNASSARWWDELVPMLTGTHRVIRVDLLGYGRSAKPEGPSYALPDQARRVGVAMDRLGVGKVVVVGHSSGGAAATALAEQRPDLVAALVLISTGPHLGAHIAPPRYVDPSQWPNVSDEQLRQFTRAAFSRPGSQLPARLMNEIRAMTFHSLTTTMQASRDYVQERPLPDRLAPLGKPLLVIFGAEDRRWRSSSAADYRAVPGAIVEMLPGIGHTPILEDPARTASSLLAFTITICNRSLGTGRTRKAPAAASWIPAATSRHVLTDPVASRPPSTVPAARPPIFRLAAVVKTCPRIAAGASRCRTASSPVSCGPWPAPLKPTASMVSQPGATAAAAMLRLKSRVLARTRPSGLRGGRRASAELAIRDTTAAALISSAPRDAAPSRSWPSTGQHTRSMPAPTHDTIDVAVARRKAGRAMMALSPAASCRRNGSKDRRAEARPPDADTKDHAAGTASATSTAETATADRAPAQAATSAASAGPARLAASNVRASSAEYRASPSGLTTRGSCDVQPPATAGPDSPVSAARQATSSSGSFPTLTWIAASPSA